MTGSNIVVANLHPVVRRIIGRMQETPGPLDTPCRIWQGAVNSSGYGIVRVRMDFKVYKTITVHRLLYCFYSMEPIPDGHVIGHRCDTKLCAEFGHLEAISEGQNLTDAWARGRRSMNRLFRPSLTLTLGELSR